MQEEFVREEGRKLEGLRYFVRGLGHTRARRRSDRFCDDQTSPALNLLVACDFSMFRRALYNNNNRSLRYQYALR